MSGITINDIYAGMPDAKDEISIGQADKFFASFIIPPGLPVDKLLNGQKFLVAGYKGVGKTSILYYLQNIAQERDPSTCTSFLYFKSDFEEVRKSNMDSIAKKLTALIDISGKIQPDKLEFLHIWRWVIFKKIVDDSEEFSNGIFVYDDNWHKFVHQVNRISFSSQNKRVIALSSLAISTQASTTNGVSGEAKAVFERVAKSESAFRDLVDIVDECERLFKAIPHRKKCQIPPSVI